MNDDEDLRGALDAAFDTAEATTEVVDTPVDTSPAPEPTGSAQDVADTKEGRDKLGRFAKAVLADGKGQVPSAVPGAPVDAPVASGDLPAGTQPDLTEIPGIIAATMRPAAREHWGALPEPVRQEIVRREQEVQGVLRESASAKNIANEFSRMVTPYIPIIRAEGVDPITAVGNLMEIASVLRVGTMQEKASTLAKLVTAYGVDIFALDSALAGTAPPEPQQAGIPADLVQREVQRALSPFMEQAQMRQQQQSEKIYQEVGRELQDFAAKHEFYADVRMEMADLMEVAERNGREITMKQAYDYVCSLHPEISKVIIARQQAQSAQTLTRNAQQARSAAVSVRGAAPVGSPSKAEPSSIRDAIEAAIDSNEGRF
jgi:hypothetical protein